MANPQTENGYTRIANDILDALCKIRISGEARQVLDTIIRKTYGFGKKEDAVALSQICQMTGLKKPIACRALNKLVEMNLITRRGNDVANIYAFNKDFDSWKPLSKKITLSKKIINVIKKDNASLSLLRHTKETTTKEKRNTTEPSSGEFIFEQELEKLKNNERKDFKIIAHYWKAKDWKFENSLQFSRALRRELRAAKDLEGYSGEQIGRAITFCKKEYPDKWTLETLFKRIQDLVNKSP
jgi:phage replication O-like protein O